MQGNTSGWSGSPPVGAGLAPAPAGASFHGWSACPNCGAGWLTGAHSCQLCRQVDGMPTGIVLSSVGRRFGEYLLDGVLGVVTLGVGWLIWLAIVMKDGQTPAKQLLGMRAVKLSTSQKAGWGTTALREFLRIVIGYICAYTLIGLVLLLWLVWDKDNRELWDLAVGTAVVNDPGNILVGSPGPHRPSLPRS
jgi:uncharacterized RDD family membrane protein YckC